MGPLEEQVAALKGRLREPDSLMREYERRGASQVLESESVAAWLAGGDKQLVGEKLKEEVGEGYGGGEGELYHAMLAARIGLLVQEVDRLQSCQGREEERRVVTQEEWERIQSSLDRGVVEVDSQAGEQTTGDAEAEQVNKLKEEVEMLKAETKELSKERDHLSNNCEKYKEDLSIEAKFRKEMEVTWNSRGEEYRSESNSLADKLVATEQSLAKAQSGFKALAEASRRDLRTLTADREKVEKILHIDYHTTLTMIRVHDASCMNFNPIFAAGNRVEKASARKRQPCWKTQVNHQSEYATSAGYKLL